MLITKSIAGGRGGDGAGGKADHGEAEALRSGVAGGL
nr:MAG TPA: hypothetical protein [Caudoviricetes sp.]